MILKTAKEWLQVNEDSGNQRGVLPEGSKGEEGGASSHVFRTQGYEHRSTSLKRVLTAALALPLGGAFVAGIVAYRSGLSTVDERIVKSESVIEMRKDISDIKGVINGGSDNGMPDRKGLKEMVIQMWYVDNAPTPPKKGKK